MKKTPNPLAEKYRIKGPPNTNSGAFLMFPLRIIVSDGGGWDHVSVSLPNKCPSWDSMCEVKRMFFRDDEVAFQLHPAKAQYVNFHPHCLHLWRPQTSVEIARIRAEWEASREEWPYGDLRSPGTIPLPPVHFVGPLSEVGA